MKVHQSTGDDTDTSDEAYAEQVAAIVRQRLLLNIASSAGRPFPSPEALADLLIASATDLHDQIALATADDETNELAIRLGPFWSRARVAEALGATDQEPLGLPTADEAIVYPIWQFHRADGLIAVKPGIEVMLPALRRHDQWTVALLLRTPAPELDGRTPLDLADRFDDDTLERLRALARHVDAEWAA